MIRPSFPSILYKTTVQSSLFLLAHQCEWAYDLGLSVCPSVCLSVCPLDTYFGLLSFKYMSLLCGQHVRCSLKPSNCGILHETVGRAHLRNGASLEDSFMLALFNTKMHYITNKIFVLQFCNVCYIGRQFLISFV